LESEDEEPKSAIECSMSFVLLDKNGDQVAAGECKGTIDKEYLTVHPKFGNALPFHLREISGVEPENYQIILPTFSDRARDLPTERFEEAEYVKYKIALHRIPSLQFIRSMFIGRIIHSLPEQWKSHVMELLKFNLTAQDDTIKWKEQ
jgi:hypothetical protein